jgi:hypothetical protein
MESPSELAREVLEELVWLGQQRSRPVEQVADERFVVWQGLALRLRSYDPGGVATDVALAAGFTEPRELGFAAVLAVFFTAMGALAAKWNELEAEALGRVRESLN